MIYKIKMRKEDFFKINNKIVSSNLEINEEDVLFEVEGGSLQIIKKSKYEFKIIESLQSKIIRFTSKYSLLIIGILFLFSILYINMYRVSKITFNRYTPINDEIEKEISSSFRRLFFYDFCNLDYQKISKKYRLKYSEYPYINIEFKDNIINVNIYNYDEPNKMISTDGQGDIIAKKDGVIDVFYVYNGKNLVSKNQFVKSGDILICGTLNNSYVQASGLVMATTYEKLNIKVPKNKKSSLYTGKSDQYFNIDFFSLNFNINKDNNFIGYDYNEIVTFNLFDFFTIKKIEVVEKNDIILTYNYEEALEEAITIINNDFTNTQVNSLEKIIDMAPTKVIETNDTYDFTFIVKKYESIGIFKNY